MIACVTTSQTSAVNVAFGTDRNLAHTRIAKSLCTFVLLQRNCAIARLSVEDRPWGADLRLAMPPRLAMPGLRPAEADGWYRNGRWVSLWRTMARGNAQRTDVCSRGDFLAWRSIPVPARGGALSGAPLHFDQAPASAAWNGP